MVDLAVVVCEPAPARALTVAPLLKQLADDGVPHMLFINKIDTLEGSVSDTLAALQGFAGSPLVLRQVPIMDGETVSGYVDVVSERAYRYRKGQASELMQIPSEMQDDEQDALNKLVEVLADRDDALLEKVLEDVKPTTAEIYSDLRKDLAAGAVIEVLLGSAENAGGVRRLWKALRHDTPMAAETAARKGIDAEGPPLAQVFKTVHAGHTGKLSYARIWRGTIKDGVTLGGTRLGGIYRMPGGELAKVTDAAEGDVVALGRLDGVPTGATVSPGATPEQLPFPEAPPPVYSLAIATSDHKDDAKLSGALQKQREADPTLSMEQEQDTSETVLHGQGEMHLISTVDRLAKDYGLKVTTHKPQVAFKETIRRAVHEHGRLKKQSGGHGQFADVKIDIAPRAARRGVRVHRQDRRRRGAAQLHPRGRRGGGGVGEEGTVRLPGGRYLGDAGGWRFPLGGQLRHGVQDRDQPGDEGRAGEGGADPAGAGRPRDDQRAERVHAAGAASADRTARTDPRICREGRLARLGRRGGAGAGGGTA